MQRGAAKNELLRHNASKRRVWRTQVSQLQNGGAGQTNSGSKQPLFGSEHKMRERERERGEGREPKRLCFGLLEVVSGLRCELQERDKEGRGKRIWWD